MSSINNNLPVQIPTTSVTSQQAQDVTRSLATALQNSDLPSDQKAAGVALLQNLLPIEQDPSTLPAMMKALQVLEQAWFGGGSPQDVKNNDSGAPPPGNPPPPQDPPPANDQQQPPPPPQDPPPANDQQQPPPPPQDPPPPANDQQQPPPRDQQPPPPDGQGQPPPHGQPPPPSPSSPTTSTVSGVSSGSGAQGDYTVAQCKSDILNLCKSQGKPPPTEPMLSTIAQGIVQGVKDNFTGKNSIGDFSNVPASVTGKMLVSIASQESNFGANGEDAGGIMQTAPIRLQQYNTAHGTNLTEGQLASDPSLAMKVGCWCISDVEGTLGKQAGNVGIPSSLPMQMAYYWNYNPTADHGHANELADYMQEMKSNMSALGVDSQYTS